jgi:hypothetical protein
MNLGKLPPSCIAHPTELACYIEFRPDALYQFMPVPVMRYVRLSLGAGSWSSQVVERSTIVAPSYSFLSPAHCTVGATLLRTPY